MPGGDEKKKKERKKKRTETRREIEWDKKTGRPLLSLVARVKGARWVCLKLFNQSQLLATGAREKSAGAGEKRTGDTVSTRRRRRVSATMSNGRESGRRAGAPRVDGARFKAPRRKQRRAK